MKLYVGIDISKHHSSVGIVDEQGLRLTGAQTYRNHLPATQKLEADLAMIASNHNATELFCATEATGLLDWHLLEYLAQSERLASYQPKIYRLNPRQVAAFAKVMPQKDKTDLNDAFVIANYIRFELPSHQFNGNMDYIPLQRLTRFRKHIVGQMTQEKNYFLTHLFLKFSAYSSVKPFSDVFGATSCAFLEEFFSPDEVASASVETLLDFVIDNGKNRFANPQQVVEKLHQVARESYRIRPQLAQSVNLVLATTLNNIRALKKSLKEVNNAIGKAFGGFTTTLETIPGMGPIYSAGIFAEIGDITRFDTQAQLARYAGLAWRRHQSGNFEASDRPLMRQSNAIFRYYLVEAANSVKNHNREYRVFYQKKYNEARTHKHKRALVLTARKLVRLIYSMLKNGTIYQKPKAQSHESE